MAKNKSHSGGAPSQRQLRVGEVIRRRMAEVFQRGEIHDPDLNRFSITVSEVRCSPDLSVATAFVLPLGGDGKEEMLEAIQRNKGEIRHQVSKALQIKHVPDIRYMLDDTFDRMDATRAMLADDHVRQDLDE